MELKTAATPSPTASAGTDTRRRRRNGHAEETGVRFFLPKPGSTATVPELGQEVASEGEALIQAFKSGLVFYTLAAWKAVPEVNGEGSPRIVKQSATPKQLASSISKTDQHS